METATAAAENRQRVLLSAIGDLHAFVKASTRYDTAIMYITFISFGVMVVGIGSTIWQIVRMHKMIKNIARSPPDNDDAATTTTS